MAAGDRENTLTLKAADLSSQPIREIIGQMEKLIDTQKRLNQAADQGKAKEGEFKGALQNTTAIATAFVNAKSNLDQYRESLNKLEAQLARAADAARARDDLKAKTPANEKEQGALEKQIARAEKSLASAEKAVDSASKVFEKASANIERMGVSFEGLDEAEHKVVAGLSEIIPVVQAANISMLSLAENHRKAAQAAAADAAAEKAFAAERRAIADEEIARLKRIDQAIEFSRQTQHNARQSQIEDAFRLKDAQNKEAAEAEAAVKRQQAAAAALRASQEKVAQAREAVPAATPLAASPEAAPAFSRASQAIEQAIAPEAAARSTIQGIEEQVNRFTEALGGAKRRTQDYLNDANKLVAVFVSLREKGNLVDTFERQAEVTSRLAAQIKILDQEIEADIALYRRMGVAEAEIEQRQLRAINQVKSLTTSYNSQNAKLTEYGAALRAAGLDTNNLEAEMQRLTRVGAQAAETYEGLRTKAGKTTEVGFLGLRPYELQNLSYQVNDVFTQLASGTPVFQILAQQGGQFFQLFQTQLATAVGNIKNLPLAIGGITVAVGAAVAAVALLNSALDRAAERRSFGALATLSVDPQFSVEGLEAATKAAAKLGASYGDASKAAKELAGAGFNDAQIKVLIEFATNLSKARPDLSLADAIKAVRSAAVGSFDDLRKFTQNFVNVREETLLFAKTQSDAGNAYKAFQAVIEEAAPKAAAAAKANTGVLTLFFRDLANGYNDAADKVDKAVTKIEAASRRVSPAMFDASAFGVLAVPTGSFPQGNRNNDRNNVGNLEFRNQPGATSDGRFARFATPEAGVEAAARQYLKGNEQDGLRTVRQLVEHYTPPRRNVDAQGRRGDNDDAVVDRYIATAAQAIGAKPDEAVSLRNPETLKKYIQAVNKNEGGARLSEETIAKGVASALGNGAGTPFGTAPKVTEGVKSATDTFVEDVTKQTLKLKDLRVTGETSLERERQILDEEDKDLRKKAQESAGQQNQTALDKDRVEAAIADRRRVREADFAEARLRNETDLSKQVGEIRDAQNAKDKTSVDEYIKSSDSKFAGLRESIRQKFTGPEAAQRVNGKTQDELLADVAKLQTNDRAQAYLEASKAVVDNVVKARDEQIKAVQALGLGVTQTTDRVAKIMADFGPKISAAVGQSTDALNKRNNLLGRQDTPEAAAVRDRNERLLNQQNNVSRNPEVTSVSNQLQGEAQKEFASQIAIRDAKFKEIVEKERSNTITLAQGTAEAARVLSETGPKIAEGLKKTEADLLHLRDSPLTTDQQKAEIDALIAKNRADAAHTQEQFEAVITAGLKDDQEKLDAAFQERNRVVADIQKRIQDGLITSPLEAARLLAEASAKFNPQIREYSKKVVDNIGTALQVPGLSPGLRAQLGARSTQAGLEGDTGKFDLETKRTQIDNTIKGVQNDAVGGIQDTQRTQQQLLSRGLTTQTSAEEAIKRAYADANRAGAQQLQELNQLIDEYKKLGASDAQVDRIRDKIKLLSSDLQYVDPLVQQITSGLENSFASRGEQAFETVAKSIGNLIVNGGKFKDVIAATGQAFAQFTSGILEDIAKIIIKYELLKLVRDALGDQDIGKDGSSGGSAGSGAGGAGGILGILGKLVGSGGGLGGASNTAFDGAGIGSTELASGASQAAATGSSVFDTIELAALHSGGLVGSDGFRKVVDLSLFREARRMHQGGMVGLQPDEVPAILQRGERVVTKADAARQAQAAAGGTGGATAVRNVLAVGDSEIARAMNGSHGEQVVINHLRRNAPTVKRLLGN